MIQNVFVFYKQQNIEFMATSGCDKLRIKQIIFLKPRKNSACCKLNFTKNNKLKNNCDMKIVNKDGIVCSVILYARGMKAAGYFVREGSSERYGDRYCDKLFGDARPSGK